jgi:hypothetical protein
MGVCISHPISRLIPGACWQHTPTIRTRYMYMQSHLHWKAASAWGLASMATRVDEGIVSPQLAAIACNVFRSVGERASVPRRRPIACAASSSGRIGYEGASARGHWARDLDMHALSQRRHCVTGGAFSNNNGTKEEASPQPEGCPNAAFACSRVSC